MLFSYLILAISVSIDSLGIGITYGLRNTKISKIANIILFTMSIIITSLSVIIGNKITNIFPEYISNFVGAMFLICMGIWVIYEALKNKEEINNYQLLNNDPKIYRIFIEFLGITIQIIRDPISSDLDNSKKIDWKEALYLGIALSIDSICVGICSSILGYTSMLFPIFVASFQLVFLSIGRLFGKKIASASNIPENIWSVLSGVLLICIGISRFII